MGCDSQTQLGELETPIDIGIPTKPRLTASPNRPFQGQIWVQRPIALRTYYPREKYSVVRKAYIYVY